MRCHAARGSRAFIVMLMWRCDGVTWEQVRTRRRSHSASNEGYPPPPLDPRAPPPEPHPGCAAVSKRQRRARTHFTPEMIAALETSYAIDTLPSNEVKRELAARIGVTCKTVKMWFQNRRARAPCKEKKAIVRTARVLQTLGAACRAAWSAEQDAPRALTSS